MIRAALTIAFIVAIARPYSAAGQTVPAQNIPPLCRCEEDSRPEPAPLPKHFLPYIAYNATPRPALVQP